MAVFVEFQSGEWGHQRFMDRGNGADHEWSAWG